MKDKDLDTSTELEKAKKLAKMMNALVMTYATKFLSSTAMLDVIYNVQDEAGWITGNACQMFDILKQKYNPNDKLSSAQ